MLVALLVELAAARAVQQHRQAVQLANRLADDRRGVQAIQVRVSANHAEIRHYASLLSSLIPWHVRRCSMAGLHLCYYYCFIVIHVILQRCYLDLF